MKKLGVHVIVLTRPTHTTVEESVQLATEVFGPVGIQIELREVCSRSEPDLEHLEIQGCARPWTPLYDEWHHSMFTLRCTASDRDIAVYFITSTTPVLSGCSQHPPNVPGFFITASATRWTLAHELGHILGLAHRRGDNALMSLSTNSISKTAKLSFDETELLLKSPWLTEVTG